LQNFRCFRQADIDLSGDIVAIYGRNGTGKTGIFDALEFVLTGEIGRFSRESNPPLFLRNALAEGPLPERGLCLMPAMTED
jgi:DNA repair exonuclease SbcCD ATPase subunit